MIESLKKLIKNKTLLKTTSLINGQWVDRDNQNSLKVINPANGDVITSIPYVSNAQTLEAIHSASKAFKTWKKTPASECSAILRKWYNLIESNKQDIATIMTIEQGKPLAESLAEIKYGNAFIDWFTEEAKRIHGDIYPNNYSDNKLLGIKEPVGVTAAITPWNFPHAMVTRKISPAIAAGCTIILKPSEETPLTALALAELSIQAGFPKGILNVLVGDPQKIGEILCKNNTVRKLSFTGSTQVGKLLYKQCAPSIKKLSLELGGNAPFIVFKDADVKKAAIDLSKAKSRNTGQSCTNVNRVLVHEDVYTDFVEKTVKEYSKLQISNGLDNKDQGPLINTESVDKVERLIADAKKNGAKIIYKSKHPEGKCFYPLTIIEVPDYNLAIAQEEIFGPVIALYKFSNYDKMMEFANGTNYGLAAYFYSTNQNTIWQASADLEFGMIGINDTAIANETIPFCGVKHSGFGYEGSKYGIEEYLHIKHCCIKK